MQDLRFNDLPFTFYLGESGCQEEVGCDGSTTEKVRGKQENISGGYTKTAR